MTPPSQQQARAEALRRYTDMASSGASEYRAFILGSEWATGEVEDAYRPLLEAARDFAEFALDLSDRPGLTRAANEFLRTLGAADSTEGDADA